MFDEAVGAAEPAATGVAPPTGFELKHPWVPALFIWRLDPRFPGLWAAFQRACQLYLKAEGGG